MTRPPYIAGDRIELSPPSEDDIDFLLTGVNHPKIRRYISIFRMPYTAERYEEELWPYDTDGDNATFLIVPREGETAGEPVGSAQLAPITERDGYANLGIWLHPDEWGNGYALEAGARLIEYGFNSLRLHRITASAAAPNDASIRLCERLDFRHEGTAREAQFLEGEYVNVERFGLLKTEWSGPDAILAR